MNFVRPPRSACELTRYAQRNYKSDRNEAGRCCDAGIEPQPCIAASSNNNNQTTFPSATAIVRFMQYSHARLPCGVLIQDFTSVLLSNLFLSDDSSSVPQGIIAVAAAETAPFVIDGLSSARKHLRIDVYLYGLGR